MAFATALCFNPRVAGAAAVAQTALCRPAETARNAAGAAAPTTSPIAFQCDEGRSFVPRRTFRAPRQLPAARGVGLRMSTGPEGGKKGGCVVLKFGGASVATLEQFQRIADIVISKLSTFERVAVVISAMAGETDRLIGLAKSVNAASPQREVDMLISTGERISCSLLAMALQGKGQRALSFTGSQAGIITDEVHNSANILEVRPIRILKHMNDGEVAVVAGFQGVSIQGEITTLGRGGSDTSAVALAIALGASHVEFYKDVKGVYSADPKKDKGAVFYSHLPFDKAAEMMEAGAKVLHSRAVRLAEANGLPLHVLSFETYAPGAKPGTVISAAEGANYRLIGEGTKNSFEERQRTPVPASLL
eukprot:tig00021435_g21389.t1